MPFSVPSCTYDWTRKSQSVEPERTKNARTREFGFVVDDVSLEEWGEEEKKWWEDRAEGVLWGYSARHSGSTGDVLQRRQGAEMSESRWLRKDSRAVDLEAGQTEPSNENGPLPLGRKHGILEKRFTLHRDVGFSGEMTDLEDSGDESAAIPGLPSLQYPPPRQQTDATRAADTTSANIRKEAHFPGESFDRPTARPFFAWLTHMLSRSEKPPSSILRDKEKEASTTRYACSEDSLSGIDDEDVLPPQIEKRLRKRMGKEKRKLAGTDNPKHVADVRQRQEFMLRFARAHLMFSGPSHRLQSQLRATAQVLDLEVSTVQLPNVILMSFDDESTGTSMVKIIQQTGTLNLEKLSIMHELFWKVIHNELSVSSASATLDLLMRSPSRYDTWETVLTGGLSSSAICTIAFSGSFADSLAVFPLGCLLVMVQLISAKHELYSNVFEITVATVLSFLSAMLASSGMFCYAAVASSSVVLILPGFFVLNGSLELASKHIVSGAVRICFAVIYALFLGFGISIGAQVFTRITHHPVIGPDDFLCSAAHHPADPWWQRKPSLWWAFLTVPLFSLALSLHNHAPMFKRETFVTVLISCVGWTANHFAGVAFHGRPDLQSAMGAFAVGVIANIYARIFSGNAYVVMITGILFQLPSGLANGGLLTFAERDNDAKNGDFTSFEAGFQVALQLIAVAMGLTVGLFTSVVVVHPLGGGRKGALNAMFSL